MAPLKNTRHELFAQALARGEVLEEAYEQAGFKRDASNARKLLYQKVPASSLIQGRVEELKQEGAEKNAITVDRVLQEWARMAFSDLRDVMDWGRPGLNMALKASDEIPDDAALAIQSVSEEMTATGFKYKIQMHDKKAALAFLSKYLGIDAEGNVTEEPLADRLKRIRENRKKAAKQ
jgi:phage terminase small subunit